MKFALHCNLKSSSTQAQPTRRRRDHVKFEEICIINIENMGRELSPYQKRRLVEEVRKG